MKDTNTAPRLRKRLLGEMLVAQGVVTQRQLDEVLARQKSGKAARLGRLLVEMGHATEAQICEAIAEQLQIPAADLVAVDVPNDVLDRVSKDLALKYLVLPWFVEGRDLYLIMADPTNVEAADAIAFHTGMRVLPVVAPETEVIAAIERFYAAEESSLSQFDNLDLAEQLSIVNDSEAEAPEEAGEQAAQRAPVVKLVNAILVDAVHSGASDIHVEPQERGVNLRYRVDGLLRHVMSMPKRVQAKIVSRVKIMSNMDIAERRKPQDGRTRIIVGTKCYDMRVSTLPTADGEKAVIRILVQDRARVGLDELGFEPDVLASFRELLRRPQGLILVTGPTGSGKTSTLYAALNAVKSETLNVITVEDPIEYRLAGVSQVAVSDKSGLSFAAGLRSILRQDPDVIMVGEIRDLETAEIAFQAAQTGHLVLSSLHTNDAPSAAARLIEIGIPAYLVTSSVIAILAQRLARRLCDCKTIRADGRADAKGCEACRFTGFRGRIAVYELLRLTPRLRSVLLARGSEDDVRAAARASGMRTMFHDGMRKVERGVTTAEELTRAVPPDEPSEMRPAAQIDLPSPLSEEARRPDRTRILIVEDEPAFRESLKETLASSNFDVISAANGDEALRIIYQEKPDLVLTDLHMPVMDGLELLQHIRGDLSTCQIPVIFLTVIDSHAAEAQALDMGADDYVTKPVENGILLSRIRRSLFRSHLLRVAP
ncbi:MAG: Flp pilus assembly complex ATPase component TadA [Vicinamibacteria bacterium]|nr:Flp pilus assembly complex ATPase component TadA [Vicinamibacteria bacterium]